MGWSPFPYNRVLHQALARSPYESKVRFVVEDIWTFRERASGQKGRIHSLRMDIITEAGALFDTHLRRKNKKLLLNIAIVDPSASSNLENCNTPCRKTPRRHSLAEEKQVSGLVPRQLLPPSSRFVDVW